MNKSLTSILMAALIASACSSDSTNTDTEKPVIDANYAAAFPTSCVSIERGSTFVFRARFTDNEALGAYSISIHSNFEHHSHDSEVEECDTDHDHAHDEHPTPVNPWNFIRSYTIDEVTNEYIAEHSITVPADIDPGDYHLMIQLSDAQGWSTMQGISIEIEE